MISERYGGEVPRRLDELVEVPGVGRKTAAVVLGNAFGRHQGIAVDTHVGRIVRRLGFTEETDPVKVERLLLELVPRRAWTMFTHLLIAHGRAICQSRTPRCEACVLLSLCPEGARRVGGSAASRIRSTRRALRGHRSAVASRHGSTRPRALRRSTGTTLRPTLRRPRGRAPADELGGPRARRARRPRRTPQRAARGRRSHRRPGSEATTTPRSSPAAGNSSARSRRCRPTSNNASPRCRRA